MKHVRASSDLRVAAAAAGVKVASEEAIRFRSQSPGKTWAGLDSNQRRRKASRFTVCPVWPLRYLPVKRKEFSYILAPDSLQLAISCPAGVDRVGATFTF